MTESQIIRIQDEPRQPSFRPAMDFLINKRAAQFSEGIPFEQLQARAENIRQEALRNLPNLLEQAESMLQARGIQVHWAETAAQACDIIASISGRHPDTTLIKGKSMVSEEIHLNAAIEKQQPVLETDMGEYIVQMAGEAPSHIIMPAIHKSKKDIARLFHHNLGTDPDLDVDDLIQVGRKVLRQAFNESKVGLSGVNFIAADTGTLCLVENEGNGRMCTTMPDIHIAVTGIEKVIPRLADLPDLIKVLTRSATGQAITTYVNMIQGPRTADDRDGPREVHLVLLDNGRTEIYQQKEQQQSLQCIRCGACMNHCPVYTRIGGHAYQTTYPGPIGKIISPHLKSQGQVPDHPKASSLCGACVRVCPVHIPITDILLDHRQKAASKQKGLEPFVWKIWSWLNRNSGKYNWLMNIALKVYPWMPKWLGGWTKHRKAPALSKKTLHQLMAEREEGGRKS